MPLVSAADSRVHEIRRLQQEAACHKRELYRHKGELRRVKTALATLDAQQPHTGEGDIHGHQHTGS